MMHSIHCYQSDSIPGNIITCHNLIKKSLTSNRNYNLNKNNKKSTRGVTAELSDLRVSDKGEDVNKEQSDKVDKRARNVYPGRMPLLGKRHE